MNKKCITNVFVLLLLFSTPKVVAMQWEKYIVPIGLIAIITSFTALLFIKNNFDAGSFEIKKQIKPIEAGAEKRLKKEAELEKSIPHNIKQKIVLKVKDFYDFQSRECEYNYLKNLYKQCKKVINNYYDNSSDVQMFLNSIHTQIPKLLDRLCEERWRKLLVVICLLSCKFNHTLLLAKIMIKKGESRFLDNICLDAAILYQQHEIERICELLDTQERAVKQSLEGILKKNLKQDLYQNYYHYNLVANYFETMLYRAKTDDDKTVITQLLDNTLKDKIDIQLQLLFVVVKNRYKLLEETLKTLFNLTCASKNSKGQTLYHLAYSLCKIESRPISIKSVIKQLTMKKIGHINDQDLTNKTALHYVVDLWHRKYSFMNLAKSLAIKCLLTHPDINLSFTDEKNRLIIYCFLEDPDLAQFLLNQNFNPQQIMGSNMTLLSLLFMHKSDMCCPKEEYVKYDQVIDFALGMPTNPVIMTKQLQLLPIEQVIHEKSREPSIYEDTQYKMINFLTNSCIARGGSLTESTKDQPSAIDVARTQYHSVLNKDTISRQELIKKEMIYHIYLTNTKPRWSTVYCVLSIVRIPKELAQMITKFYYYVTMEEEVDRTIAFEEQKIFTHMSLCRARPCSLCSNSYYLNSEQERKCHRQDIHNKLLQGIA